MVSQAFLPSNWKMNRILKDKDLEFELFKKGFVKIPFLSDGEVAILLEFAKNRIPKETNRIPNDESVEKSKMAHVTLLDSNIEYKAAVDKLIFEMFSPKVSELFVDREILTGGFYLKPSGSDEIGLHRDWTFTDSFNDVNITVWCPLADVDETNGSLFFVEGSHKLVDNIEGPGVPHFFDDYRNELKNRSISLPLKAGEAVLFDNTVLHGSKINMSEYPRYVANFLCVRRGCKTVFYSSDTETPASGFNVFETDSDFYITHSFSDYFSGRFKAKSLGFVENKNRSVSLEEFEDLLERGVEIRRRIYYPDIETL